jgi:hypothetical protein
MTYYTTNQDGSIAASAKFQFSPEAQQLNPDWQIVHTPKGQLVIAKTPEEAAELQKPDPEEALRQQIAQVDAETSTAIFAGFDYEVAGQTYRFSYGELDQQNFADTANMATFSLMQMPGVPGQVVWNGWLVERDEAGNELRRELERLTLTVQEFLALYMQGALAHKVSKMEEGSRRKEELFTQYEMQQ